MPMLKVGDEAPDFKVTTHTGEEVSLADFRGQTVILWFYPKADTPGCTAEGCGFRDRQADYDAKNARILGVSFDTPEENRGFAEKFGYRFPLLCDTERRIGMAYGACDSPDAQHAKRVSYVISPAGKIAQVHEKVSAATHPEELLKTL